MEAWRAKGPIVRFRQWLEDNHFIADEDIAAIEREVDAEIVAAVAFAEAGTLEPSKISSVSP